MSTDEIAAEETTQDEIDEILKDTKTQFDDRIQSRMLMCRIQTAYQGGHGKNHNCLGCNLNAVTEQLSTYLGLLAGNSTDFTPEHAYSLYFHHVNVMWERITDVFDILSVPKRYRERHYQPMIRSRRWTNFFKHPKEFGWLVHHPIYVMSGTREHSRYTADAKSHLFVDDEFVKDFYACDRASGLAKRFRQNQSSTVVILPDLRELTIGVVGSLENFVNVVTKNPVYFEILNDEATIEDFFKTQCESE